MNKIEQLTVSDILPRDKENAPLIFQDLTIGEVASLFNQQRLEDAFVADGKGRVVGMITLKILFHGLTEGGRNLPVSDVMEKTYPFVNPSDSVVKCFDIFVKGHKMIAVLNQDQSLAQILGIEDVRSLLQKELECMNIDIDHLPLNDLNPQIPLKILKSLSDNDYMRFCVTDEKGRIQLFNRAYETLTGINRKEAMGKHVKEIFPESRIPYVLETGKEEVRYYKSTFENRYVVSRRLPLKEKGKIIGVLSFTLFRDITEMEDLLQKFSLIKNKMDYYKTELEAIRFSKYGIDNIIGHSEKILQMKKFINKYALGDSTVIIVGESGTGKELVAHSIHQASKRKHNPLIVVNCASIPKDLLESELFGYEPGAFTGANLKGKPGKFELAHEGTIFLDEVGDLPLDMQAKLLRVIQEREVERIGGKSPIPLDFRLVAATNKNLESLCHEGTFREDLYYRLSVLTIRVPPLRERKEDLLPLAKYILDKLSLKFRRGSYSICEEVIKIFDNYNWPGNVRELENALEYAVNNTSSNVIFVDSLPSSLNVAKPFIPSPSALLGHIPIQDAMAEVEKSFIVNALNRVKGNRTEAAHLLCTSRSGLYKLLKKHGIK
jgi:PAS domain S-box-containing protein